MLILWMGVERLIYPGPAHLCGHDFLEKTLSNHGAATGLAGLGPCPETPPASVVLQLGPSSFQGEQVRSSWVYDSFSF